MAYEGFKLKLNAILSAGVEGYRRLVGGDEKKTVRKLAGSLRSLPSTACGPIWGVCYIKCAFIIVVSGNL
jgi:hypothetical protein